MKKVPEGFIQLSFENGQDITAQQFNNEYDKGHFFIYIELKNNQFSPKINLPNADTLDPLRGSIIKIVNESTCSSIVSCPSGASSLDFTLDSGKDFSALGHPGLGWKIVI